MVVNVYNGSPVKQSNAVLRKIKVKKRKTKPQTKQVSKGNRRKIIAPRSAVPVFTLPFEGGSVFVHCLFLSFALLSIMQLNISKDLST